MREIDKQKNHLPTQEGARKLKLKDGSIVMAYPDTFLFNLIKKTLEPNQTGG